MPQSVFAKFEQKSWPYRFAGKIVVEHLVGGTPSDQRTIEGWIKKNLGADSGDLIRQQVGEVMAEVGGDIETAAAEVAKTANLNKFKFDDQGLYIEGRHLKACLKEGANVAVASGKLAKGRAWGETKKGLLGFLAEHVFVVEDRLHLGRTEPDGIQQRFVHNFRGSSIQYEEYCEEVEIPFTIMSDYMFSDEQWAMIWTTAQLQGIGSTRSQGYGKFVITEWQSAN